jgi:hypothetical protein
MQPKATHYEILKVGSEPNKRFLQKTMNGTNWTSQGYAQKFLDLGEAVKEQRKHENSYIIWVGFYHKDGVAKQSGWGEVNRHYIEKTF